MVYKQSIWGNKQVVQPGLANKLFDITILSQEIKTPITTAVDPYNNFNVDVI
jgi:hypothetical protein